MSTNQNCPNCSTDEVKVSHFLQSLCPNPAPRPPEPAAQVAPRLREAAAWAVQVLTDLGRLIDGGEKDGDRRRIHVKALERAVRAGHDLNAALQNPHDRGVASGMPVNSEPTAASLNGEAMEIPPPEFTSGFDAGIDFALKGLTYSNQIGKFDAWKNFRLQFPEPAAPSPVVTMSPLEKQQLWDAITAYVGACGVTKVPGYDPGGIRASTSAAVEKVVYAMLSSRALGFVPPAGGVDLDAIEEAITNYGRTVGTLYSPYRKAKEALGHLRSALASTPSNTGAPLEAAEGIIWDLIIALHQTKGDGEKAHEARVQEAAKKVLALAAGNTGGTERTQKLMRDFCEAYDKKILDLPLARQLFGELVEGEDGSAGAPPTPGASPELRDAVERFLEARDGLDAIPDGEAGDNEIGRRAEMASGLNQDMDAAIMDMRSALEDEAPAESASEAQPSSPDPLFLYREENRHLSDTKAHNAPRLTLDRPLFDGADIMRLNRLAEQFPQYEQSTRWKSLGPLIDWAIEVRPVPREAQAPAEPRPRECWVWWAQGVAVDVTYFPKTGYTCMVEAPGEAGPAATVQRIRDAISQWANDQEYETASALVLAIGKMVAAGSVGKEKGGPA